MKKIPLTQGKVALVDDEDYEFLMQWKWRYDPRGYAVRTQYISGGRKTILMHRLILNAFHGIEIDHIDRNGLNNQSQNMRFATRAENCRNVGAHKDSASKYKGVSWYARDKIWTANIMIENKQTYLGRFQSEIEAAKAYNLEALIHHGKFAVLNKVA